MTEEETTERVLKAAHTYLAEIRLTYEIAGVQTLTLAAAINVLLTAHTDDIRRIKNLTIDDAIDRLRAAYDEAGVGFACHFLTMNMPSLVASQAYGSVTKGFARYFDAHKKGVSI